MGGSGGRISYTRNDVETLRQQAVEAAEKQRVDSEVNVLLNEELLEINDRDADTINEYLEAIKNGLGDSVNDFETLLFGGSVAKRTWVNGLSDIDSLVIMDVGDRSPEEAKAELEQAIRQRVPMGHIAEISTGSMAVTVRYRDGTVIQLLPAGRSGDDELTIPSADGRSWVQIEPRRFSRELTRVNRTQGNSVVPAIKLAKSILANRLGDEAPSGYHVEALAVAAFDTYSGARNPKAMVTHLFESAARDVLRPARDITGQSPRIDETLGPAGSASRRKLARTISGIARTMRDSRSVDDWKELLGE